MPGYVMTHTVTGAEDMDGCERNSKHPPPAPPPQHTAYRPEGGAIQLANKGVKHLLKSDKSEEE